MANANPLSGGCLSSVMTGQIIPSPVLQVLNVKRIDPQAGGSGERFRLILSDGVQYAQAMLATTLNDLCVRNIVTKHTVVRLTNYTVNDVNARGKMIIIIISLDVVSNIDRIGNPTPYGEGPAVSNNAGSNNYAGDNSFNNSTNNGNLGYNKQQQQQQQQQQSYQPYQHNNNSNTNRQNQNGQFSNSNISNGNGLQAQPAFNNGSSNNGNNYTRNNNNMEGGNYHNSHANNFNNQQGGFNGGGMAGGFNSNAGPSRAITGTIFPIASLSPYANKWTIKARVQSKGDVRMYTNQKGEGKLFNCVLMDESGEIQATGWREQVDQLHPMLDEGRVYLISGGRIQVRGKFNNTNNDYEMVFDRSTTVEPCADAADIPVVRYTATQLSDLAQIEKDSTTDVLGIIRNVHDLQNIVAKSTGRPMVKREVEIADASLYSVRLTLWGKHAETFSGTEGSVILAKNVKVGDFQGRSLSLLHSGVLMINPDVPDAHQLLGWYNNEGRNAQFTPYSNNMGEGGGAGGIGAGGRKQESKTFAQVKDEQLGMGEKADYFNCVATIISIRSESMSYPACPNQGCGKKVIQDNGQWRCEKCQQTFPQPEYRYIMSVAAVDATSQAWLQCFNDIGNVIMGKTATEMQQLKDMDSSAFEAAVAAANFTQFKFRVRAKQETYNDETRVRYAALSATPLTDNTSILAYTKELNDTISAYEAL
ncbi:Replication factor A protein 1 [Sorochytrium milnesiophthora]